MKSTARDNAAFVRTGGPAPTSQSGFTLLELLTVIAIISALAALTLGVGGYARRKAGSSRAKAEIAAMEMALENFKVDNGTYPITPGNRPIDMSSPEYTNSYILYKALVGGSKTYFTFKLNQLETNSTSGANGFYIRDPFGHHYNYYCSPGAVAQANQVTFDLWSYGPDGQDNTADDITNWKQ